MKINDSKRKSYTAALFFVIAAVAFDQWTKYLAVTILKKNGPVILIDKVFQLSYLENRGAAFGLFQDKKIYFLLCGVFVLLAVIYVYGRLLENRRYLPLRICAILICAGAVGNMADRIRLGYVVDFLYFSLIDFPVFNVADIYVTVAAFALILLILCYYKEEDLDRLFQRRNRRKYKN